MTQTKPRIRDPRLDFFRGVGMFIIFVAHLPGNPWTLWIPARFGFSDATEIFVFCSGMASAIAFGAVFDRHGWLMGAARVLYRVWQVYWAQIVLIFVILAMLFAIDQTGYFEKNFVDGLNLRNFLNHPGENLVGLLTLTYVPNYFDILPMYIVILMLLPFVMALSRIHPYAAIGACVALWLGVSQPWIVLNNFEWFTDPVHGLGMEIPVFGGLNLPAEAHGRTPRTWFFNPFAWQLVFFTGFAFMRGWIPAPPVSRKLMWIAGAFILVTIPFAYFRLLGTFPELRAVRNEIGPFTTKTFFGLFRYIHFLAIAYLAWIAAGVAGRNLPSTGWAGKIVEIVKQVGQQSLAVFLVSLVIAQLCGVVLSTIEPQSFSFLHEGSAGLYNAGPTLLFLFKVFLINMFGFAALVVTAWTTAWFKSSPWKRRPEVATQSMPAAGSVQGALASPDKR